MTREDTDRLFELLKIYFPNNRRLQDAKLKAAWLLLLEPFSPELVKDCVVVTLRKSRNLPDPQVIAELCSKKEGGGESLPAPAPAAPEVSVYARQTRECLLQWRSEWHAELRERKLPTLHQALDSGLSPQQWERTLADAGVWPETNLPPPPPDGEKSADTKKP